MLVLVVLSQLQDLRLEATLLILITLTMTDKVMLEGIIYQGQLESIRTMQLEQLTIPLD